MACFPGETRYLLYQDGESWVHLTALSGKSLLSVDRTAGLLGGCGLNVSSHMHKLTPNSPRGGVGRWSGLDEIKGWDPHGRIGVLVRRGKDQGSLSPPKEETARRQPGRGPSLLLGTLISDLQPLPLWEMSVDWAAQPMLFMATQVDSDSSQQGNDKSQHSWKKFNGISRSLKTMAAS